MSVKKILLLGATSAAVVGMTAAMAGGFTHEPADSSNYYVEGHAGYARQNYLDNQDWRLASGMAGNNSNNNASGGFSGGADAGYNINHNYGVELGWFHLPTVNTMAAGVAAAYLKSTVWYLAGKYMVPAPWMQNTDWFFKLGVAYRKATLDAAAVAVAGGLGTANSSSKFVRPMFATGLDYSFSDMFSGVVQYALFLGANNSFHVTSAAAAAGGSALETVSANVFTLGLAYKFTV
ncbi:MAG TPA: hypothetical protein VI844_00095 [Coxiellaceae bacterium]|nr:hypothetical protein [Coxiellaceae bacterium]